MRQQRYGDISVAFKNRNPLFVHLSRPAAIRQIFNADPQKFEVGSSNDPLRPLLGENSLVLLDGDRHQRQRKLLMPPFHGDRMRTYGQLICEITEQAIASWPIQKPFSIRAAMQDISLRVILSAVFGLHAEQGQRYETLRQLITKLLDSFGSPLSSLLLFFPSLQKDWGPWSPWGRFLRLRGQIDRLLYEEIEQRRQNFDPNREDILSLLLSARDEAGQPMTDRELRDELMTLLVAGHETTASALAWAFYWIDRLPQVRDRLLAELDSLPPDAPASAITKLPYLNAVCCETLRIYPIAITAFTRVAKVPLEIAGYQFEPGTVFIVSTYLTHHREDLYPEPKQFKPERFLERQFSPYEFLPFGGGNRLCIGAAFAQYEMKLVLATVLSRCELKRHNGASFFGRKHSHPVKPVRRGLTMAPPNNLQMVLTQ